RMGAPSTAGLPRLQAPALPGMVPGATGIPRAPVGSPTSSGNGGLIDFLGNMAGNTTLGGIFKSLFPDAWYGAGEAIKGGLGGLPQLGQSAPSLPRSLTPSQSYAATNAAAAANPKYKSNAWRMGEDSGADRKGGSLLS